MCEDNEKVSDESPATWITAIAARQDRRAFGELFAFYAPRIKGIFMQSGSSADVGEDLAQKVLQAAWRKACYFDPEKESASTWIYTICRSLRFDRPNRGKSPKLQTVYETLKADNPARSTMEILGARPRVQFNRATTLAACFLSPWDCSTIRRNILKDTTRGNKTNKDHHSRISDRRGAWSGSDD